MDWRKRIMGKNSINLTQKAKTESNEKSNLKLQEFCDMNQLYRLLDNWSKCCGMASVIVNPEGKQVSEDFGMTEFCKTIQSCPKGKECCENTWKKNLDGNYECPFGFMDFSIPIVLPTGEVLGKVLAGQALSVSQKHEEILKRTEITGLDKRNIKKIISRINRKTEHEMQSAYELLKETLHFFIQNSYSIWNANNEIKKGPEKKDRVLSQITQIMYSYNLTVDLQTDRYTLITGTGMERTVEEYKKYSFYKDLKAFQETILHPAYIEKFYSLLDFSEARKNPSINGFLGTFEYPVLYPGAFEYEWHEINVFIDTEEDGKRIANILGRDITQVHNAQEKSENELKAAAAKNQILSEITKMLYSYNLTLNLHTGKYSMIIGTGMTQFMEIFKSTDDYETAYRQKISCLDPEYVIQFAALASIESLRARKNSNGFIGNLEYGALTDYGEEWHEINVFITTDEQGEPVANILGRDITESHKRQKQKENQQKATVARDQLLSGITKLLYSYNLTVNLKTWKYSLITGTGMSKILEEMQKDDDYVLVYKKLLKEFAEEDKNTIEELIGISALKSKTEKSGFVGTITCRVPVGEKSEWHEINLFMGTNEDGIPVANILGRDVTEAHDKADTKAQLKIANASNAAKSAFLFNMSHDIRTPMNAIIGFTDLLEKHIDNKELAKSYIKKIQTSSDFLLSLINNVLEMARIESGKTTLDETYWNICKFNDTLFSLFDSQMKEKRIEFTRTSNVEHDSVLCDETKLRQIFLNILSNSLKYTPVGGKVTMDMCEIPSDMPGYAMYKTVIEDTGIGMSEEFLPHLFEEFTRERSSTESKLNGTGLGMPIVKKLVELMKGSIEVESHVGKGTKITVILPHRIAQEDDICLEIKKSQKYDKKNFEGKRILLAEDNDLNAEIAITILDEAGFEVERAADGIICVDMMEKSPTGYYDLILMDIQMPNMDGYKATKTIRKLSDPQKAGITIIAMTANAFDEDRKNAYNAGMNAHIAKPIKIEKLYEIIEQNLR